ncbi:MAG: hypothetical protein ACOYKE_04550 [Ferruginibacter sp.]
MHELLSSCGCVQLPLLHTQFNTTFFGFDETAGRFAQVSIDTCKHCGSHWLHYAYEIEGISYSGKWFRVPITAKDIVLITPMNAAAFLCNQPWYFYGGSYFNSTGAKSSVPLTQL